jgi:hypothetical protein
MVNSELGAFASRLRAGEPFAESRDFEARDSPASSPYRQQGLCRFMKRHRPGATGSCNLFCFRRPHGRRRKRIRFTGAL